MNKFRKWLLIMLVGDYSVVMNTDLNSKRALLRKKQVFMFNSVSGVDDYTVTDGDGSGFNIK